ncbi:alpha-glucosidase [Deinobacterium chartae]|uniref:Alpha-glucosidase n=1 Tax=Deinobacterium chartae TaxID=521158 RepID=A0A841I411_9DEIO|nr:alpha-amylase family glycosyl hydrolase [Deinobacterium chartae]MBB6099128.1 alpha-glucosidase [Deinobacterium chartae]
MDPHASSVPVEPAHPALRGLKWWQRGIIYQIYPRSFMDANGDGVGDLRGITSRLDYLASLGIAAIWLSPIFPSPMADFGYDVADYTGVDPLFGSLADFDALLEAAHARGLHVLLDLVPNHTSDQHPWFLEARSSRDNPKRDWYVWADPKENGRRPNNWLSFFGGPAWTLDEASGQYYLHQFLPQQPELNWRNPEVRAAIADAMRFWLDRGVDGFRVDVIWLLGKDEALRDEPINPDFRPGMPPHHQLLHPYTQDLPETHRYIAEMRALLDEYSARGRERTMVGEIYLPFERLVTYYGSAEAPECHMPFNFILTQTGWDARKIRAQADRYDALVGEGWPNWVLGNHDQPRVLSRFGREQARVATTLLLTLRGTPTVYYGDEIGMADVDIPPERVQDPAGLRQPGVKAASRDPERTPMQWSDADFAGFSTREPWLPLAEDYRTVNVALQDRDPNSLLNYFRALTRLRAVTPELVAGAYHSLEAGFDDVFVYTRSLEVGTVLVALNFGGAARTLHLPGLGAAGSVLLSSVRREGEVPLEALELAPHEALVVRLR